MKSIETFAVPGRGLVKTIDGREYPKAMHLRDGDEAQIDGHTWRVIGTEHVTILTSPTRARPTIGLIVIRK